MRSLPGAIPSRLNLVYWENDPSYEKDVKLLTSIIEGAEYQTITLKSGIHLTNVNILSSEVTNCTITRRREVKIIFVESKPV